MDGNSHDPDRASGGAPEHGPGASGGAGAPEGDLNVVLRGGNPAFQGFDNPAPVEPGAAAEPPAPPVPAAAPSVSEAERIRLSLRSAAEDDDSAPAFYSSAPAPGMGKWLWIALGAAVLIAAAVFVLPMLRGAKPVQEQAGLPIPGAGGGDPVGRPDAAEGESADDGAVPMSSRGGSTAGGSGSGAAAAGESSGVLSAIALDDAFYDGLSAAITSANARWKAAGSKNYVYRVSATESTVPATSQTLNINAFVGGPDPGAATAEAASTAFMDALEPYLAGLRAHSGVSVLIALNPRHEDAYPLSTDRYVHYGYDYGMENKREIDEVIGYLEGYKRDKGHYPLSLNEAGGSVKTKGNIMFEAGGFGYVPLFKTDGAGNIIMGSGKGLASYQPADTPGYYLFKFLMDPTTGMDVFGAADVQYYRDKISSFPYQPAGPLHNVGLNPDGKPDGVGAVIKNGDIQP